MGVAQVMSATVTLYFLVFTGTSGLTITSTLVTLCLVLMSKVLFANVDRKD